MPSITPVVEVLLDPQERRKVNGQRTAGGFREVGTGPAKSRTAGLMGNLANGKISRVEPVVTIRFARTAIRCASGSRPGLTVALRRSETAPREITA
jgi:hypothetical protein